MVPTSISVNLPDFLAWPGYLLVALYTEPVSWLLFGVWWLLREFGVEPLYENAVEHRDVKEFLEAVWWEFLLALGAVFTFIPVWVAWQLHAIHTLYALATTVLGAVIYMPVVSLLRAWLTRWWDEDEWEPTVAETAVSSAAPLGVEVAKALAGAPAPALPVWLGLTGVALAFASTWGVERPPF